MQFRFALLFIVVTLFIMPSHAQPTDDVEILWDEWGVPHIYAPDDAGLFYGFGWAQAHLHADVLLELYAQSRGRAAEYAGGSFLESDIEVQTWGVPELAAAGYDDLSDEYRAYLDAFAAGFNAYAADHLHEIDDTWEAVLPVLPTDIVAHGIRTLRFLFVGGGARGVARQWQRGDLTPVIPEPVAGSNGWTISPSNSASGNAMLVANPHQPWEGWGRWTEAHLNSPTTHLYGAALLGSGTIGVGFNEHLGWTHTVNVHDGWDLYELTLVDDGYLFDGEVLPFDVTEKTLRIRQDDGAFEEMNLTVKQSVHGPIVAEREDKALALRVVGDNGLAAAEQWWEMAHATNLDEFEAAMRDIRIPMFTTMYADKAGNILMVSNGLVPVRGQGDWAFWSNQTVAEAGTPSIIAGDRSDLLWTEYHPYEDLPRLLNPESGWMQNANETPFTTTLPIPFSESDFPPYMLPEPFILPRSPHALRLLAGDDSITYDELVGYKFSTYVETTRWILDDLIAAARERDNPVLNRAVEVLSEWDRTTQADSVGAVLYTLWSINYLGGAGYDAFEVAWDIDDPINTPRGLADPDAALNALAQSTSQLIAAGLLGQATLDTPYGEVFRLRQGEYDLPASGGNDLLGTVSIITPEQDEDGKFRTVHGDSFIAIIEFGETIRANVLLTHGNATQSHSPHLGDQLTLFAEQTLRPALLTREDVEEAVIRREILHRP